MIWTWASDNMKDPPNESFMNDGRRCWREFGPECNLRQVRHSGSSILPYLGAYVMLCSEQDAYILLTTTSPTV
jgi:hypothetical protein